MDMTKMLGSGQGEGYEGDQEQEERGHNPLLVLHLLLQGRYWIAVLLAVIFAVAGAVVGYKVTKTTYSCTGLIHIRPVISPLLFNGSGTMPMYEQFVRTQVVMLKGQRCIDLAMGSVRWTGSGRSNSNEAAAQFTRKLSVFNEGEIIHVVYTDPDPATAKDAVAAVIDAYQQLMVDLDPDNNIRKQAQLDELKRGYEKSLEDARRAITELAKPYTPAALENRYNYKLTEAAQAESEWRYSQQAIDNWKIRHGIDPKAEATGAATQAAVTEGVPAATQAVATSSPSTPASAARGTAAAATAAAAPVSQLARGNPSTAPGAPVAARGAVPAGATPASTQPKVYTAEFIARTDAEMRNLLQLRRNAQLQLDAMLKRVGPNHPEAQGLKKNVDLFDDQIAAYAAHWTPEDATAGPQITPADPRAGLEQLIAKAALDEARFNAANAEVNQLGSAVTQIREIETSQQQKIQWLAETRQKLEELRVSLNNAGHISVLSPGDRPKYLDRRLPIAAAAGFGGGVLGFAVIIVWGLLDRRLRTIDQARMSLRQGMRVLGMLPSLPKNLEDPSAASFAALCVHHIRMLLQVMPRLDGHPAIAVTSPSPGDGKTSLTMALALSYAASGKSTLLIDCDIVGAGLTRRVNAIIRRRIGQILIRENLLTAAELREALSAAQRTGRRLGEVLVDEGFVDADQLEKALKTQGETSVGLLDVMRGEVLEDCVAETGTPRLWILPVGSALAEHGATISPEGFRTVLDQARKRFDVILVDTGPVPGAIESSVAASQVDGVVLTVSRGEQGPLVKRAAEHLRDIGGRALGVVFNRATPEDFSSSYSSMSKPSIPERVREKPGVTDMQAFGPVAAAVAGQQRTLKEGKE